MSKEVINNLDYLIKYIEDYSMHNGYAPSYRDMAAHFGVSLSTIHSKLHKLKEMGRVNLSSKASRSLTTNSQREDRLIRIPKVGRIACGQPITAIENIEEFITVSEALTGTGEFFMLQAYGESMVEAGIGHGDLVIVRQQNAAETGDIVVALLDDEATLKRYYPEPENKRIRLHPENASMSDIYVDKCDIQGVAVKVIKDAC